MPHETPLISTIVAGLVLAFIFGAIANRFRMPPLVGYLVAGVLVGPATPGFTADPELASELAEIGVILLMFGVGLHFSLKDLLSVRALAIPGAVVQIAGATGLGVGLALLMGWTLGAGLVFGLALSVASTVVLLKALQDRRLIDSERGRIAVGWLIVEDLAMVLALVLIPALATLLGGGGEGVYVPVDPFVSFAERMTGIDLGLGGVLGVTLVKLAAFGGFMLIVGRRVIPFILHATAHTGSRELFRLAVLAIALGVAAGAAYLFGVSLALGAFFAGMILSESELSHRAAQESLPLRDAFAVLFFVSVGMLFDPAVIIHDPLPVIATVLIIVFGKSILAFMIVAAFRRPVGTALTISASLAQIGEFSFILAALGVSLGILPPEGRDLILAGAIISILLNPLVFWGLERARPRIEARMHGGRMAEPGPRAEPGLEGAPAVEPSTVEVEEPADLVPTAVPTTLTNHIILIGFGRVGSVIAEGLHAEKAAFCLIEDAEGRILAARAQGIEVIVGNAASPEVLHLANVEGARAIMIGIPNAFEAGQATEQARRLNPLIRIIARAHSDEEVQHLTHLGANTVIMGEREIGLGMLDWLDGEETPIKTGLSDTPSSETGPKLRPAENVVAAAAAAATLPVIDAVVMPEPPAPDAPEAPAPVGPLPAAELVVLSELSPAIPVESQGAPEVAMPEILADAVVSPGLPEVIAEARDPTAEADAGADAVPVETPTESAVSDAASDAAILDAVSDAIILGGPGPQELPGNAPVEMPVPDLPVEQPQPGDPVPGPLPEEFPPVEEPVGIPAVPPEEFPPLPDPGEPDIPPPPSEPAFPVPPGPDVPQEPEAPAEPEAPIEEPAGEPWEIPPVTPETRDP